VLVPPAEVAIDAEYVELAMTNGTGATTVVANPEKPAVLVGVFAVGCGAGAAVGVVPDVGFTDCTTREVTLAAAERGLVFGVAEVEFGCSDCTEGAELTSDVEVSMR